MAVRPLAESSANTFDSGTPDERLMQGLIAHDSRAMAEVYRRFEPLLHAFGIRLLVNPLMAEEVAQDVLWQLWTHAERFDPRRGSLRSYLLARMHGRAIDVLRSETARRRREEVVSRRSDRPADVETDVLARLEAARTRAALSQLPAAERDAITLAFLGGVTYREVARLLDQPEGTVKSRIRSGLLRLRCVLAPPDLVGTAR